MMTVSVGHGISSSIFGLKSVCLKLLCQIFYRIRWFQITELSASLWLWLCLYYCKRVEVSPTTLHPLQWVSEGSVYCQIQILDKRDAVGVLWRKHDDIITRAILLTLMLTAEAWDSFYCLDLVTGTCWWRQKASALVQLRDPAGTNSPLSCPAHYTTYWETSGLYLSTKMGQYLCGMWNNNNALWEYYTGAANGGQLVTNVCVSPAKIFLLRFLNR